jgi:hypothetical protein
MLGRQAQRRCVNFDGLVFEGYSNGATDVRAFVCQLAQGRQTRVCVAILKARKEGSLGSGPPEREGRTRQM